MEILHEFIIFSKEKSTIMFLDSLIKFFFNSFYEKKDEYELIYDECATNSSQNYIV